jgi:hypothetical protein
VRHKAPGIFGWTFLLLICCAEGCAGVPAEECKPNERAADAERIWRHQHLHDYQFVWQRTCFCLPEAVQPIRVTVRDGVIASATDLSGTPVADSIRQSLLTIDALYERVLGGERSGAKVRFDCAGAGVPLQVYIDPRARVADDEFRVTITQFTADAAAPEAASIH